MDAAEKRKKRDGYYDAADLAIQAMNRENVEAFGNLKLSDWDRINIIQRVRTLYTESARKARRRYYEIATEAYILGLIMCGIGPKKAHEMADSGITSEWVDDVLSQTDFITLYRFDTETERKAYALAEALEGGLNRDDEIRKALRFWSLQLGQYAINVTDYAVVQAFQDAGVDMAEWVTVMDGRECNECYSYNGQVFRIDELPPKPHWGCRCRFRPVFRREAD